MFFYPELFKFLEKEKFSCSYKYVFVETVDKTKSGSEACFRIYSLAFGSEERIYQSFMHQ